MKKLCYAIALLLVITRGVSAGVEDPNYIDELFSTRPGFVVEYSNDPNELLKCTWDAIVNVIDANDIDQSCKEKVIDRVICPVFDFPLMSKLALGRKNWSKFNSQQREKFIDIFVERLSSSYREKMLLYTGQKAVFKPAVHKGKNLQIPMNLMSEEKNIAILYKLRKKDNCWKIYDVEIAGVSIVLTYRSQFDDVLGRGSADDLIALLKKQVVCDKTSKKSP